MLLHNDNQNLSPLIYNKDKNIKYELKIFTSLTI